MPNLYILNNEEDDKIAYNTLVDIEQSLNSMIDSAHYIQKDMETLRGDYRLFYANHKHHIVDELLKIKGRINLIIQENQ